MRVGKAIRSIAVATLAGCVLLSACSGKGPFRQVQVCLSSPEETVAFKLVMRSVAQANGLEFFDRSIEAEAEGERIKRLLPDHLVAHPKILISGVRKDGVSFGAANFAEAPTQIVIGFQLGKQGAGREFSNTVAQALGERWTVREGPDPEISGAFPLPECDKARSLG